MKRISFNPLSHALLRELFSTALCKESMTRKLFFINLFLLFGFCCHAAVTTVKINLWSGTTVCADDWSSGYQVISASKLADVAAGDDIVVTVSALSPTSATPMLMLNNGKWATLTDAATIQLKGVALPYEAVIPVTTAMADEIKSGGFIVKGCGYTFTSVDLNHKIESGNSEDKGDAVVNVWQGSQVISWITGNSHWVKIDKEKFSNVAVGNKIRMSVGNLAISTTGRIIDGAWKAFDEIKNTYPIQGNYYEYVLTETMVNRLKETGLIVSGVGYTLTSVDIIDPLKEYIIVSQIDKADIKAWEKGEIPKLSVTLTNTETVPLTVPYTVYVYHDMIDETTLTYPLFQKYSLDVELTAGETRQVTLPFSNLDTPGFYRMTANVNGNDVCSYNIGYDPTGIESKEDAQPDFWSYWDNAKAQLASIAPDYQLEEMTAFSTANRKVYKVSMKSVPDAIGEEPVVIMGYYAEPVAPGTYPALIRFQGTDSGKGTLPNPMNGDDKPGWIEFTLSTRGQMLCRDDKYGFDFYSYAWGDTARHYYRNAYLDCVRAVDFIKSREKTNVQEIFGAGGSQGGTFVFVAAGLTESFRAIAPSITGHAEFVQGMRIVNWPRAKFLAAQQALGMTDEQRDVFNSYYDTKNFVSRITCPVITSLSLQDATDPPRTNIVPFNLLDKVASEDKQYIVNPFLGYATPADWEPTFLSFFKRYMTVNESSEPSTTVWSGEKAINWSAADGNGWQVIPATSFANIKSGMKIRFNFTDLSIGAQGHITTGSWQDMPDAKEYLPLTASFFEFTVTDDMLAELQGGGCIVTGIGYTLTSVDIITPSLIPDVTCTMNVADITCWEQGEEPQIRVLLKNNEEKEAKVNVKLALRTDKYETHSQQARELRLAAGAEEIVSFPLTLTPGFYHAVVEANYGLLRDFNIGYDPANIATTTDMQSDFDVFWTQAKTELASVSPEYKLTEIPEKSTAKRKVYLVEMKSVGNGDGQPVTIRGYYAEPVAAGTYPVVITQNGYDSGGYAPYCMGGDDNPEWIELIMSNRGQLINNRVPYKEENAFYGDWFQYNFGNKDTYYYRGAYMDVVRSIDFIASREKTQQENIFMTGASQGGAFAIAGAALDSRLNAIAPAIQFMGDFPNYFKVGAWPASRAFAQQQTLGLSDEALYSFLSYFDTKNLASNITCPVITCMGLQDPVCPPRTNFAPYNTLASGEKQYIVNDNCQHETPSDWYETYMAFFRKHLKQPTGITGINVSEVEIDKVYNIAGQRVGRDYKGLVIKNGKKIVQ